MVELVFDIFWSVPWEHYFLHSIVYGYLIRITFFHTIFINSFQHEVERYFEDYWMFIGSIFLLIHKKEIRWQWVIVHRVITNKKKHQKDIKNIGHSVKCYLILKRKSPASFSYLQIFTLYAIQILIYFSSSFHFSV